MNKETLRKHCEKMCRMYESNPSSNVYMEHRLVLAMLDDGKCEEHHGRYKPIILQEHDAEPRRLKAILDTATDEIYVRKLTRQDTEILGTTIEEVTEDGRL